MSNYLIKIHTSIRSDAQSVRSQFKKTLNKPNWLQIFFHKEIIKRLWKMKLQLHHLKLVSHLFTQLWTCKNYLSNKLCSKTQQALLRFWLKSRLKLIKVSSMSQIISLIICSLQIMLPASIKLTKIVKQGFVSEAIYKTCSGKMCENGAIIISKIFQHLKARSDLCRSYAFTQ